jgi:hypothetical protein
METDSGAQRHANAVETLSREANAVAPDMPADVAEGYDLLLAGTWPVWLCPV